MIKFLKQVALATGVCLAIGTIAWIAGSRAGRQGPSKQPDKRETDDLRARLAAAEVRTEALATTLSVEVQTSIADLNERADQQEANLHRMIGVIEGLFEGRPEPKHEKVASISGGGRSVQTLVASAMTEATGS